jgi:hypothetical protein
MKTLYTLDIAAGYPSAFKRYEGLTADQLAEVAHEHGASIPAEWLTGKSLNRDDSLNDWSWHITRTT